MTDNPGWKLKGQFEEGKEGTRHFQGMLVTPQVRFSSVKKAFPRAHIEMARSRAALEKYVLKDETRVDVYTPSDIPSIFEYQRQVAEAWSNDEFMKMCSNVLEEKKDETAMLYLDILVKRDIEAGKRGCEWIAINPMWRSSWKKFWRSIIKRDGINGRKDTEGEVRQEIQGSGDEEDTGSIDKASSEESGDEAARNEVCVTEG